MSAHSGWGHSGTESQSFSNSA